MLPWRSKKSLMVGISHLDVLAEHHLRILAVFVDMLRDPAVFNQDTGLFDNAFLSYAEFRYFLYLRLLVEDAKSASLVLPPWDVALLFYSHLLFPNKLFADLEQGVWGLKPTPADEIADVLKRFVFPLAQLVTASNLADWKENYSAYEWEQKYPRIPYLPWQKAREGRIIRLAQTRTVVTIPLRCPTCGGSVRCGVVEWPAFRKGEKSVPCRRANCQPVRYQELLPQFKSPWETTEALGEALTRAMGGVESILLAEPHSKSGLKHALTRYGRFMNLFRTTRKVHPVLALTPSPDIDLFWRTHRIMPSQYMAWCVEHVGRSVDDDETIGHDVFSEDSKEVRRTERMWIAAYRKPYWHVKRSVIDRLLGRGGSGSTTGKKAKSLRANAVARTGIPRFKYDSGAYTFMNISSPELVPNRLSNVEGIPRLDPRAEGMRRRRTFDGTMLPHGALPDQARPRGSFVATPARNSIGRVSSNTATKRRSRGDRTVNVLPPIKSMDSMMDCPSDGSEDVDSKHVAQIERETGMFRTKSPMSFNSMVFEKAALSTASMDSLSTTVNSASNSIAASSPPTSPSYPPSSPSLKTEDSPQASPTCIPPASAKASPTAKGGFMASFKSRRTQSLDRGTSAATTSTPPNTGASRLGRLGSLRGRRSSSASADLNRRSAKSRDNLTIPGEATRRFSSSDVGVTHLASSSSRTANFATRPGDATRPSIPHRLGSAQGSVNFSHPSNPRSPGLGMSPSHLPGEAMRAGSSRGESSSNLFRSGSSHGNLPRPGEATRPNSSSGAWPKATGSRAEYIAYGLSGSVGRHGPPAPIWGYRGDPVAMPGRGRSLSFGASPPLSYLGVAEGLGGTPGYTFRSGSRSNSLDGGRVNRVSLNGDTPRGSVDGETTVGGYSGGRRLSSDQPPGLVEMAGKYGSEKENIPKDLGIMRELRMKTGVEMGRYTEIGMAVPMGISGQGYQISGFERRELVRY